MGQILALLKSAEILPELSKQNRAVSLLQHSKKPSLRAAQAPVEQLHKDWLRAHILAAHAFGLPTRVYIADSVQQTR